jgi:soluble lytic murein transglycosylase
LSGLGNAAQALWLGDPGASVVAARAAWSALPGGSLGARSAATLGQALLQADRPAEAIAPLTAALASPQTGLEGQLLLALGQALIRAGRPAEALAPLAAAIKLGQTPAARSARWMEAEALLEAGQVAPALARLETLVASGAADPSTRRGRLLLAGARRLAGRDQEALSTYRTLAIEEAGSPEAAKALTALEGWFAAAGWGDPLTGQDRLRRAERLLQRGRPEAALAEAGMAAATAPTARVALVQALALAGLGRLEEAVEQARPLADSREPGVRRGAQWLLARDASRAGRTEEATTRYAAVAQTLALVPGLGEPRSRDLADEAAYLAAWLWYDAGDFRKAVTRLEAFARSRPASPRADDARWFAAWSSHRAGDRAGALSRLSRLERGPLEDAALYWQGRLGGRRDRLRRAALAGGDGWYGWLARRRLEAMGATPPTPAGVDLPAVGPLEAMSLRDGSSARLEAVAGLIGLGWRDQAQQALETLTHRGAGRSTAVEVCRLATFADEPALAFRVARDLLGQARGTERWLYPLAFESVLAPAARAAGLDEALLHALVRRESHFQPEARSGAGAVGLGQLLPRTAARLGVVGDLAADPAPRLTDPGTNLSLSALYLGLLLDRFGSDAAALAAYNAGPAAPAGWLGARGDASLDEWVENVPYKETRIYLKTVLSTREVYRRRIGLPPALDPAARVPASVEGVAF